MARVLCDTATQWLEDLPPYERGSKDIQGTLHAVGSEVERIDAEKDNLRDNFFPALGGDYLRFWEQELGLAVAPPDKTTEQRRTSILGFMAKLRSDGSGLNWEAAMTALLGTSWSYQEHDPADGTSPAPNVIRVLIPFQPALPAPGGLAGVAGGGGTLAAGTYVYAVTARNFYGETPASATISKTVTANQRVDLTWGAVTGATGYSVYRGPDADHLSRIADVSSASYSDTGGAAVGGGPPTVNTTEGFQAYEAKALARRLTPAHVDLIFGLSVGFVLDVSRLGDVL